MGRTSKTLINFISQKRCFYRWRHRTWYRINSARSIFAVLPKIWKCSLLNTNIDFLIRSFGVANAAVGSSTQKVSAAVTRKIKALKNSWLRNVVGMLWSDAISNEELYWRMDQLPADIHRSYIKKEYCWLPLLMESPTSRSDRLENECHITVESWRELIYISANH